MIETVWQDVKHAMRVLRRSPLFAAIAIASLAIGIAGNAAIVSVADALLLRPLPGIRNADRLIEVSRTQDGTGFDNMSYPNYVDYRDRNTVFDGLAGFDWGGVALGLGADNGAERVQGTAVSSNYFTVLGVPMALGRAFRADEDRVGAPASVIVMTAFSLVPLRIAGWIAGSVGLIGLLLAAIGVYGITSHSVTQRTREIGIRIVLGALRGEILRLMLRQAMMLVALGGLIGLAASALGSRLLTGLLYGIQPIDPVAFAGGALSLFTIVVLASVLPALRATALNPVDALRAE